MVLGTSTSPIAPYCELVIKQLPDADVTKINSLKRISSNDYVSLMATLPPNGKAELDALYAACQKPDPEAPKALESLNSKLKMLWDIYQKLTTSQK